MNSIVKVSDITRFIEADAPLDIAESWDNVGLMLGNPDRNVTSVLVCLDITAKVVDEARKHGCQLIVTHHPFVFHPMMNINTTNYKGNLAIKLISSSISVYSAHTNLDYAHDGVNQCLADLMGLQDTTFIKAHPQDRKDEAGRLFGLGRVGELKQGMDVMDLCKFVKDALGANCVRLVCPNKYDKERHIKRVAVYGGSFDFDDMSDVLASGADVLVTGDLRYSHVMEYSDEGIFFIDAGHFSTEKVVVEQLKNKLSNKFKNISFFASEVEKDPFIYV